MGTSSSRTQLHLGGRYIAILFFCSDLYSSPVAQILLGPLPRNVSRPDIECPGDTISYSCSVMSNSEIAELMWSVSIPGEMPLTVLYNGTSAVNSESNLDTRVSTILTRRDTTILTELTRLENIESLITFTLRDGSLNNTKVQCSSEDLNAKNLTVFVNASGMTKCNNLACNVMQLITSVPLSPTNFQTTEEYETRLDITFTFDWNPPSSGGVETIIDYYTITIMPQPLSHPISSDFPEPLVNVTLSYNAHYTVAIVSVNCVGQSSPVTLSITNTGEYKYCMTQHAYYIVYSLIHFLKYLAGCGIPVPPQNGHFGDYSSTRDGTLVTFQCSDAYVPSVVLITICTRLGLWLPAPQDHVCILETGRTINKVLQNM